MSKSHACDLAFDIVLKESADLFRIKYFGLVHFPTNHMICKETTAQEILNLEPKGS